MNRKIYVGNLPFKASEPELKALFPKLEMSCLSKLSRTGKLANWEIFPSDKSIQWEGPESCFHAESDRFHGEKFAGKRDESQPWLSREMVIKI